MKEIVQFGKMRPFFYDQEIEEICLTELRKYDLLPDKPGPVRVDRFIEKKYGFSCTPADISEGVLGFTRFGSNGPEEIVTAMHLESADIVTVRRLRTTLAHEVGHCLLHTHLFINSTSPKQFCRTVENHNYDGEWQEWQANRAMASLLIPSPLLAEAVRPFSKGGGLLDDGQMLVDTESAVIELSRVFNVNPVVVRLRLKSIYKS